MNGAAGKARLLLWRRAVGLAEKPERQSKSTVVRGQAWESP